MVAGFGGGANSGSAAIASLHGGLAVCAEERVTRVRGGRAHASATADSAFDLLLARSGASRSAITRHVIADAAGESSGPPHEAYPAADRISHHFAHACTAYLTSPLSSAAIVICDHEAPRVSVWQGRGATIAPIEWPWRGAGFADVFSRCSAAFGIPGTASDQRLEALARLHPDVRDGGVDRLFQLTDDQLVVDPALEAFIADGRDHGHDHGPHGARLASALQRRLAELLLDLLGRVRRQTGATAVCLGGSLFYHSSINTAVRRSGIFDEVFVPVDPGNSGLACGAALHGLGTSPRPVSPFLGPAYSPDEIKQALDNCKLQYAWESEGAAIGAAVDALQHGRLVGWFDGAMEWGPRALGARCILANPMAPYVLENLNHYLKRREPWRGYALSGLTAAVHEHFDGPPSASFMECDYRPRDAARFRHALPSPDAAVRVHTVDDAAQPRFTRLLQAVGEATGLPMVINTSFNGFHEPIVCSPRDAVRVFYGTGVDLLVINQFVLRK